MKGEKCGLFMSDFSMRYYPLNENGVVKKSHGVGGAIEGDSKSS